MTTDKQPLLAARLVALSEVVLCSGFPTQLAIGGTFAAFGDNAFTDSGALSMRYVVGLSLIDSVLVTGLVFLFLVIHGERPRDVLLGDRRVSSEAVTGVPMTFVALALAMGVVATTHL